MSTVNRQPLGEALRGSAVCATACPVDLPVCEPPKVIRLLRERSQAVVLTGGWDDAEIVVAVDPIALEVNAADPYAVFDQQPVINGPWPSGAICGGWFGWMGFPDPVRGEVPHALGFFPNVFRYHAGQWWDEALLGVIDEARLRRRRKQLRDLLDSPAHGCASYEVGPVKLSRDRAQHAAAVEQCVQRIRAGDLHQANICLSLRATFHGSAADFAADLIGTLRPRYGAYVSLAGRQLASASPELFLHRSGRAVRSQPIKGTRPRTGTAAEQAAEAERLGQSVKDRAENVMIVDLVRNDLSQIARVGSVTVPELLKVVPAPGVWHLVSTVTATARPDASAGDLLRATFPPGSVSGSPKHEALRVIAQLEDRPRGVYTGAIGYAGPGGGAQFNVAIRTFERDGSRLTLGVGGGITADSSPVQEWWECFDKARPLLGAVGAQLAEPSVTTRPPRDSRWAAGIFDTCLMHDGVAREATEHLARLQRSAAELYHLTLGPAAVLPLTQPAPKRLGWQRQRVTVLPDGTTTVVRAAVDAPACVSEQRGADAVLVEYGNLGGGLGGHKWADRRRPERLEAAHPGCVVLLADRGLLTEATRANVVAVVGDRLVTAPLDGRILPGVTRTVLLDLAAELGIAAELRAPTPGECSALATVGSISGLTWIRRCGQLCWDAPGPLLTELSRRLLERWGAGATVRR